MLWSWEPPFVLFSGYGNYWVLSQYNEQLDPHCIEQALQHGGGKLMVWDCFCAEETGTLVRIKREIDQYVYKQILVHHAKPALNQFHLTLFQQNNDPKHIIKRVQKYLNGKIWPKTLLTWQVQSPYLKPIENLWKKIDHNTKFYGCHVILRIIIHIRMIYKTSFIRITIEIICKRELLYRIIRILISIVNAGR